MAANRHAKTVEHAPPQALVRKVWAFSHHRHQERAGRLTTGRFFAFGQVVQKDRAVRSLAGG
jgi:hypothetical protein